MLADFVTMTEGAINVIDPLGVRWTVFPAEKRATSEGGLISNVLAFQHRLEGKTFELIMWPAGTLLEALTSGEATAFVSRDGQTMSIAEAAATIFAKEAGKGAATVLRWGAIGLAGWYIITQSKILK